MLFVSHKRQVIIPKLLLLIVNIRSPFKSIFIFNLNDISIKTYLILITRKMMNLSTQDRLQHILGKKSLQNLTKVQQLKPQDSGDGLGLNLLPIHDTMSASSNNLPTNNPVPKSHHQYEDWDNVFCLQSQEERIQRQISNQESTHQNYTSNHSFVGVTQVSDNNSDSSLTNNFTPGQSQQRERPINTRREREHRNLNGNQENGKEFNPRSKRNIIGYIAQRSIKTALKKYRKQIAKDCQKANVSVEKFIKYYKDHEKDLYGPEKLAVLLKRSQRDDENINKMKKIFQVYFEKVLRRDYLMEALRSGKMTDINIYLQRKNACLLYFAESI